MMEQFVKFIEAVIWPILLFWIIFYFKLEIRVLIRSISRVKLKDLELQFENNLSEVEKNIGDIASRTLSKEAAEVEIKISSISNEKLSKLADSSPRTAILEAWVGVESTIQDIAGLLPITEPQRRTTYKHMLDFKRRSLIEQEVVDSFHQLGKIRNQIAHEEDFQISTEEADRYVETAKSLIRILRNLPDKNT